MNLIIFNQQIVSETGIMYLHIFHNIDMIFRQFIAHRIICIIDINYP